MKSKEEIKELEKNKPRKFIVVYRNKKGELVQFNTDNEHLAHKRAILNNVDVLIDTRYKARLRLHYYILRKALWG